MGLPSVNQPGGPAFEKVNHHGGTSYPQADVGWSQEIPLDLDMVSATCPNCNVMLVEAGSDSLDDLAAAADYAAAHGANAINNSYGVDEFSSETGYEPRYNHPGVAITAGSGDSGYDINYPAASQGVTAVGGTSLVKDGATPRG